MFSGFIGGERGLFEHSNKGSGSHLIVAGAEAERLGEGERKKCRDDEDGCWVPSHFHNSRATNELGVSLPP